MNSHQVRIKAKLNSEPNLVAFLTLFSFSTLARGLQFLVPIIIYSTFPASKEIDFYFYWSTQSNLIANFLSAIWPAALMSQIVKTRTLHGESTAQILSKLMLRKFFSYLLLIAGIMALLATNNFLGGPALTTNFNFNILWGLFFTITSSSMAIAISEIATAHRKFGLIYKGLLASALVQIVVILLFNFQLRLELSFLLGCLTQLLVGILFEPKSRKIFIELKFLEFFWTKDSYSKNETLNLLKPSKKIIFLLYLGGTFTLLSSHLSLRLLGDNPIGAISAFAIASMLALAPQQLFIQHLSTVAGIAMSESYHKSQNEFIRVSKKWRNRLFNFSLILGLSLAILSLLAMYLLPMFEWSRVSWQMSANILGFLCLPLAISGLNTWLARLTVSLEKFEAGVWYQAISNSVTIVLLFIFASNPIPFSSPLALAIAALLQLISIPIFCKLIRFKFE